MLPHERDQLGEQLSAYLDGALNAAETAEVERRLAADPQARAQLATLRETVETLRRLPRRPAPSDLLDGLTARIERAQLLEGAADAGAAVRRPRPVWRLLASAAIVVFAVGGGFWAFSRMSDTLSRNDKQVALQSAPRDELGEAARSNAASSKLRGVAAQPEAAPRADTAPRPTAPAGPIPAVHGAAAEAREEKSAADRAMLKGTEATADVAARTPSAPERDALRGIDALAPPAPAVAPPPSNLGMRAGGTAVESPTPKPQRELTRADVLHTPFPDEPVQLTVACATEPDRAATRELLVACLAAHGVEPLQADAADKRAALAPEQAYSVEGQAHRNLADADPAARLAAVRALSGSSSPAVRNLLLPLTGKAGEADPRVRYAAISAVKAIDGRLSLTENLGRIFSGLSLGSILLLGALGLAITYGVMGIINMAHGELLMIGAYSAYAMQSLFRAYFPAAIDWYLPAAIPLSFLSAALVGVVMERTVIRWLYGRTLETLLATWGLSLILIQAARVLFGAQNVEVANPAWMSGGIELMPNLLLPWNRIVIIGFALFVLLLMWVLMNRTRLGMFVRAVTQNRAMADCVGVPTARIDTLAFALGAGIAGLGGLALSQISNVGPDMGQGYIVDAFMVVVLGGVGQLAGAVWAALGLGVATKLLEGWSGAVIAKIVVLAIIIIFIQKRPQGLFALKGRFVD